MADKKTFNKLDDIGFLGTQEKGSAKQKKADIKKTIEIIRSRKAGKVFSIPHTLKAILAK